MGKGNQTKQQILDVALQMATETSLNDLTIGKLAVATGLSKSGLFSHFNSKENLQLAVIEYAHAVFRAKVTDPVLQITSPLARLTAACGNWLNWYQLQAKTCIFISAAVEFDDQPGPIRDKLSRDLQLWLSFLRDTILQAIEANELNPNLDTEQLVYEIYSLYLGSQQMLWVGLEDKEHRRFNIAFNALIARSRSLI